MFKGVLKDFDALGNGMVKLYFADGTFAYMRTPDLKAVVETCGPLLDREVEYEVNIYNVVVSMTVELVRGFAAS